ncbi:MAG: potassium channel family protein [Candidatus Njordarchaeales archaeon]
MANYKESIVIKLKIFFLSIKKSLTYACVFIILFLFVMILSGVDMDPKTVALFLSLNYEPRNTLEALALIMVIFLELSPLMAFMELRTMSEDEKVQITISQMRNHIIVIGAGHLGRRVIDWMKKMEFPFVIITLPKDRENNETIRQLIKENFPVIFGDATIGEILKDAGIDRAKGIIVTINNDLANLTIAEKARKLNPKVRVVLRLYNDELVPIALSSGYADEALSTTAISVQLFLTGTFLNVSEELPPIVPIRVNEDSPILGKSIEEIEKITNITIINLRRGNKWIGATPKITVKANDILLITGDHKSLGRLLKLYL